MVLALTVQSLTPLGKVRVEDNNDAESKVVLLAIESLVFDLENPRFKGLSDQLEALHSFCNDRYARKTVNLAEHIAKNGLNPSELMIVLKGKSRRQNIVLEGNRRLAALKLLSLPARLNETPLSPAYRARIKAAARSMDAEELKRIACRRMPSREEANAWISLKHTGENDGAGVVNWDGEEAARFRGRDPGLCLLDFVRQNATLSARADKGMQKFPVTNLERLLGDPDVRRSLGIDIVRGELLMTHNMDDVLKALTKVVEDLATGDITVTALKRKADRADYLKQIDKFLPKGEPLEQPIDFGGRSKSGSAEQVASSQNRPASSKKTTSDLVRKTVVPKSCNLPITVSRIKEVFLELRNLEPIDRFPNAGAALLRILIDTSTSEYASKCKLILEVNEHGQTDLKKRIDAVLKDVLERTGSREACNAARTALLQSNLGAIPIDRLQVHLHGRYGHPLPENMRKGWDDIEPWMKALWGILDGLSTSAGN